MAAAGEGGGGVTWQSGLIAGVLLGAAVAYAVGKAVARAQRAWRDLVAAKKTITGLWRRLVGEWLVVVKYTAAATVALVAAAAYGVWSVTR